MFFDNSPKFSTFDNVSFELHENQVLSSKHWRKTNSGIDILSFPSNNRQGQFGGIISKKTMYYIENILFGSRPLTPTGQGKETPFPDSVRGQQRKSSQTGGQYKDSVTSSEINDG